MWTETEFEQEMLLEQKQLEQELNDMIMMDSVASWDMLDDL